MQHDAPLSKAQVLVDGAATGAAETLDHAAALVARLDYAYDLSAPAQVIAPPDASLLNDLPQVVVTDAQTYSVDLTALPYAADDTLYEGDLKARRFAELLYGLKLCVEFGLRRVLFDWLAAHPLPVSLIGQDTTDINWERGTLPSHVTRYLIDSGVTVGMAAPYRGVTTPHDDGTITYTATVAARLVFPE